MILRFVDRDPWILFKIHKGEQEITSALVALLTSAVHDQEPRKNISDIHHLILQDGGTSYLVRIQNTYALKF